MEKGLDPVGNHFSDNECHNYIEKRNRTNKNHVMKEAAQ